MSDGKANGPNSFPNLILKLMKMELAEHLADIINLSFETGNYIDRLKLSKAIPIYKDKDSEFECLSYRPISLLSNLNKIAEKVMYNRLYVF